MSASPVPTSRALDRRSFIKVSALAGGGLLLGEYLNFSADTAAAQTATADAIVSAVVPADFSPNSFIRITPSGAVSIIAKNPEIGQGMKTTLPMLIAEEMDVPWSSVTVYQGDVNPVYTSAAPGGQSAGGSNGMPNNYLPMRRLGAVARVMMLQAGAQSLKVPVEECTIEKGVVYHKASGKKATYGELATLAATLPVPDVANVPLKDPKDFKIIGTRVTGVDNEKIVTGQPLFGIDVKLPGMLYANYTKCPVFGGRPVSANLDEIRKLPGVKDAFILEGGNGLKPGVAIVADSTWRSINAASKLQVVWDEGANANQNSASFAEQAAAMAKDDAPPPGLPEGTKMCEGVYHFPYLAHATLEPQNCTVMYKDGNAEIWVPTQSPGNARAPGAAQTTVHIMRSGGGFGRRLQNDYTSEAAAIAEKFPGVPVKLTWTREQDFGSDVFRPAAWHFFKGGVSPEGKLLGWNDHFVGGQGAQFQPNFPNGFIPNVNVKNGTVQTGVPSGAWRAPNDNANFWAVHSFFDEMAHAAGRDTYELHMELLATGQNQAFSSARMSGVLKLAAEKGGWGKKLPKGQGQGIAFSFSHRGYVAIVADVTVSKDGKVKVNKMTAGVDVGPVVNLSAAENQVQGGMLDGLSSAWNAKITIDKGRPQQTNFDEYNLLRMPDAAATEVHFIQGDYTIGPTGLGEPALPPSLAAVCNAIYAATGKRIRTLPFGEQDLKWS